MALLASPSRGLDTAVSGDIAQQGGTEEFRAYISAQIDRRFAGSRDVELPVLLAESYLGAPSSRAPALTSASASASTSGARAKMDAKKDDVEQVMLMVRKLREGCVASGHLDAFTLDVYELSVYLALLCLNIPQLASSLPRLVLDLYPAIPLETDTIPSPEGRNVMEDVEHIGVDSRFAVGQAASSSPADLLVLRAHMASLLLLRSLCLSSHASRLGQYASAPAAAQGASLSSSLKEYPALRQTVHASLDDQAKSIGLSALPDGATAALDVAEQVYRIVRDANVFQLHRLLSSHGALTIWQRILVLQVVPTLREVAWRTVRRAYLHVPVSSHVAILANATTTSAPQTPSGVAAARRDGDWITRVLVLGADALPEPPAQDGTVGQPTRPAPRPRTQGHDVPDEWDADDPHDGAAADDDDELSTRLAATSLAAGAPGAIEGRRLLDFISSSSSSAAIASEEVRARVSETKDGTWILKVK
ncbi:uncharacterized protein PSFLO_07100 [Pseudozyma flocculosa]|uniref:Uncharacterized protein n=1 Tax=Pseudozyma flocculosa TaxID=84751 RepID=A0A5C3FB62_9BASI|nr:uncharacterized protein PSFLO_07100 [Pseudozyma flocculosa]